MKTAIITGATGNLGQAVIKKFLSEGFKIVGTIMPGESPEVNDERLTNKAVDLTNEANSLELVEWVIAKYGRIDVAVLTVGGFALGKIADTPAMDIIKQYKLNFETAYNIARPVFMQMIKQNSGRIFLIGSRPGLDPNKAKGMVAYSLGKSLIFRLADLMNDEANGYNVVTSVVVPSTIDTPQNRSAMPGADFESWVKGEEIANVISYYSNENAKSLREPLIKVYGNS
jgi:NAD(P)-dependent dehydrogenase (short-subunit alcohol dehydrogenase family)